MGKFKYIIIFFTLWSFGGVINFVGLAPVLDIISMLLCAVLIVKNKIPIKFKYFFYLFLVWTLAAFSAILTHTDFSFYIGLLFHTLLAVLIIVGFSYDYKEINKYIYKCTKLICYLGLINFVLSIFTPFIYSDIPSDIYEAKTFLLLFNYMPSNDSLFQRNQGVFWEPGVFQLVLNLHLYNILIERRMSIKKIILPAFLIITTLSTTGLIIMVIILAYWFFTIRMKKFSMGVVILGVVISGLLLPFVYDNVKSKTESTNGSAAARTFDFLMGMEVIKSEPLIGIGMDPDNYIKRTGAQDLGRFEIKRINVERGNTNTFMNVAVMFGIPVGLLFCFALYRQNLFEKRKLIFLIFFLALMSEPLFGMVFLFLICFSSIKAPIINTLPNHQ